MGRSIAIRRLELVANPGIAGQGQAFLRHRWPGDIPADMLKLLKLMGQSRHPGMQRKSAGLCHLAVAVLCLTRQLRLQGIHFLALLWSCGDAVGDGMTVQLPQRVLFQIIQVDFPLPQTLLISMEVFQIITIKSIIRKE